MAGQNLDPGDIIVTQVLCFLSDEQQISVANRYWAVGTMTGSGNVTFQDVAGAMEGLLAVNLQAVLWNDARYEMVRVRRANPPNNDQWAVSTALAGPGTAGTVGLPSQTCGLLTFTGPTLGKHAEGRMYIPFPASADNRLNGIPTNGYVTNAGLFAAPLIVNQVINGSGTRVANLNPGTYDRATQTMQSITNVRVSPSWATQRRRGMYGRTNRLPF